MPCALFAPLYLRYTKKIATMTNVHTFRAVPMDNETLCCHWVLELSPRFVLFLLVVGHCWFVYFFFLLTFSSYTPSFYLPFSLGRIDPKGKKREEERKAERKRGSSCTTLVGQDRAGQGKTIKTMTDQRCLCNHTGFELAIVKSNPRCEMKFFFSVRRVSPYCTLPYRVYVCYVCVYVCALLTPFALSPDSFDCRQRDRSLGI